MMEKPKKERRFLKTLGKIGEILIQEVLLKVGSNLIKRIGGKKTLPSILILFLSISLFAQYPNTGNKQRLGFQTTADGLVWRGSISDTASIQPVSNQNAWVILDTVNLKIYSFDFSSNVWNQVGTGGGSAFTQPVDSLFFKTSVPPNNVDTAKMRWDSDLGTVVLGMYDAVPNELGFKNFWLVKNQTGSTITKGSIVYANGTVGASGRITVAKFIANGTIDAKYLLGITAHDLTDGEDGYVISFGKIRQVNTDTFSAGAILYPSPTVAGVWTDVEPIAPNIDMPIGFCINSSSNNGTIAIRVASGYKLSELHDVQITSPVDRASLYYRGGLWRDTTEALLVSDTASMLLPYFRDADTTLLNLANRFNTKLNISDTSVFVRDNQISGISGQVTYFNSSSSITSDAGLIYSATNKTLGINTTTTSGANLIIKNSTEPVRSTFLTQQTFAADTTNWTRGTGWTFNGTLAVATAATGNLTYTTLPDTIIPGRAYEITYSQSSYTAGTATLALGNVTLAIPQYNIGGNIILLLPTSATGGFRITTSTYTGNLDNITINEITNSAPIIFAGQDNGAATLYNSLRMPNITTLAFGGGGSRTTGLSNNFFGNITGNNNTTGASNNFIGDRAGSSNTTGDNNNFYGTESGRNNTIGSANIFFGFRSGFNSTVGNNNIFFGTASGFSNTTGSNNIYFGVESGRNSTTSINNNFFGFTAGQNNTTGNGNNFFGNSAGNVNQTGSNNVAIGLSAMNNTTLADALSGSNNTVIGSSAATNIATAAAGNLVLGNSVNLPTNNGSNQVVIKNLIFGTGASGTGTTIAAGSRVGIKTNAPNRDFEVAGEVRITDLTTDAPTRLVGADADGDLGQVTLGAGLSLTSSTLLADTNFLITRFDTASMLTNYLRTGVAAATYQTKLTNPITGTGTTNYLPIFTGSSSLGNSSIYDNGNIGIGTNNPTVAIDILNSTSAQSAKIRLSTEFASAVRTLTIGSGDGITWDIPGGTSQSPYIDVIGGDNSVGGGNFIIKTQSNNRFTVRQNGNVGINTTTPSFLLDVNGTTGLQGALTVNNATVLNEGSGDFDTRIESDGNANMVFVDASTDRVGIGTGTPSKTLDINGEVKIATVTATPTSLLGKDASNVVGEVTTVAQTGLMTTGSTTATTGTPSAVFNVTHGLGSNPTSVIVTGAGAVGAQKLIFEVYAKNSTTFSVQVWTHLGMEAASTSVTIYWLAIK
jgi:hypothetical protein